MADRVGLSRLSHVQCLAFGTQPANYNWLIAGFGHDECRDGYPSLYGRLSVWCIEEAGLCERTFIPDHRRVFDVAWHPSESQFAVGSANDDKEYGGRSGVVLYDTRHQWRPGTLPCPAADNNSVTISPYQAHLVTAAGTDGNFYVWDTRNLEKPIHAFSHGDSGREIRQGEKRELVDVGVRMSEWSPDGLFTGDSDGRVKRWDPRLATQNALKEDVYECECEIMSGCFSPNKSSLLVGDGDKGLHLLRKWVGGVPATFQKYLFIQAHEM